VIGQAKGIPMERYTITSAEILASAGSLDHSPGPEDVTCIASEGCPDDAPL
jgi:hypothetical protein